jgi:hypothetical protein
VLDMEIRVDLLIEPQHFFPGLDGNAFRAGLPLCRGKSPS